MAEVEPLPILPSRFSHVDAVEIEGEGLSRLQRVVEAVPFTREEVPDSRPASGTGRS
jgi:hypothetical protein